MPRAGAAPAALQPALLLAGEVGQELAPALTPSWSVPVAPNILGPGSPDTWRHICNKRQLSALLVALISLKG